MYKMTVLSKIKPYSDAIDYFKELPFYNKPIEKPKVKHVKDIDQSIELSFFEQLDVIKTGERKDPIVQLKASKVSIKNLFSDILNETKGFKYQITVEVLLKNTSTIQKLNLLQFILIHSQKQ